MSLIVSKDCDPDFQLTRNMKYSKGKAQRKLQVHIVKPALDYDMVPAPKYMDIPNDISHPKVVLRESDYLTPKSFTHNQVQTDPIKLEISTQTRIEECGPQIIICKDKSDPDLLICELCRSEKKNSGFGHEEPVLHTYACSDCRCLKPQRYSCFTHRDFCEYPPSFSGYVPSECQQPIFSHVRISPSQVIQSQFLPPPMFQDNYVCAEPLWSAFRQNFAPPCFPPSPGFPPPPLIPPCPMQRFGSQEQRDDSDQAMSEGLIKMSKQMAGEIADQVYNRMKKDRKCKALEPVTIKLRDPYKSENYRSSSDQE